MGNFSDNYSSSGINTGASTNNNLPFKIKDYGGTAETWNPNAAIPDWYSAPNMASSNTTGPGLSQNLMNYGSKAFDGVPDLAGGSNDLTMGGMTSTKVPGGGPKPGGSIWSNALKQPDGSGGWGSMALGVAESAANAYFAYQGLNAYKENTKNAKREFDMNYGASRQEYNTNLRDRQIARNSSNPGGAQDVESYMNENQIV
jgi:hypothetical protein